MKEEKISEIISDIDMNLIDEAANPEVKRRPVMKYIGLAACLMLTVIAGVFISRSDFISPPAISHTESTSNESGGGDKKVPEIAPSPEIVTEPTIEIATESGMMIMPQWEDLAVPMRYTEAEFNGITYGTQNTEISEENILTALGSTKMQGYDIYTDTTYTVNAELYSIKSISTECAVAIKIDGGDKYYSYVNSWYEPETLGAFIKDLDLKNTVSFGKAYIDEYVYYTNGSEHNQRVYADFDDSVIWDMLEDVYDTKNVEYNHPYDRIGIETDLPVLGYKNISFCITPDGYIITNILDTQKCFFIGTEKFTEFDKYLKDNIEFKEYNTVYELNPDGTIPGKGDTGETTPGYNPDAAVQTAPPYNPNENTISDYYIPDASSTPPAIPDDFIAEASTEIR